MGCDCQGKCQHPHKLKDSPENCTPEQIRECHGEEARQPRDQQEQSGQESQ
jgi:hypothetical protein